MAVKLGDEVSCPHCGRTHDVVREDGRGNVYEYLLFVRCEALGQTLLASVDGRNVMHIFVREEEL